MADIYSSTITVSGKILTEDSIIELIHIANKVNGVSNIKIKTDRHHEVTTTDLNVIKKYNVKNSNITSIYITPTAYLKQDSLSVNLISSSDIFDNSSILITCSDYTLYNSILSEIQTWKKHTTNQIFFYLLTSNYIGFFGFRFGILPVALAFSIWLGALMLMYKEMPKDTIMWTILIISLLSSYKIIDLFASIFPPIAFSNPGQKSEHRKKTLLIILLYFVIPFAVSIVTLLIF